MREQGSWRARALVWAVVAAVAAAQAAGVAAARENDVPPASAVRPFAVHHPLPFKYGENLVYDVKFSRFPISANVGELTFTVSAIPGSDRHVRFDVAAVSRGALTSLFGVKVNDTFTSLADSFDLAVYSTIKKLHEGDYRSHEEATFDRTGARVRFRAVNPAKPDDPGTVVEQQTRPWVQDIVSAVYFARTRNLRNVGREVRFPISDRGETYDIGIALLDREEVKTDAGTFKALKVDARIFDGRFVRREGHLHIWLTDDARRIPVKAVMKIPAGTVTFDLTKLGEGTQTIVPSRPADAETVASREE